MNDAGPSGGLPPPVVAPQVRSRAAMDAQQKRSNVENEIIASLGLGRSIDAPPTASASSRTRKTGAEKIDSIYDATDGLSLLALHLGSIDAFLASIEENPKSNHVKLLRENIDLLKKSLYEQVELIKKAANNTQELKQAASAHSKRTRNRTTDLRNSIKSNLKCARDNASKMLRGSMTILSDGLASIVGDSPTESGTAPDSPVKMPRQKKLKVDDTAKTVEIRLPQPLDGKWYSPNEFVRLFKAFESRAT